MRTVRGRENIRSIYTSLLTRVLILIVTLVSVTYILTACSLDTPERLPTIQIFEVVPSSSEVEQAELPVEVLKEDKTQEYMQENHGEGTLGPHQGDSQEILRGTLQGLPQDSLQGDIYGSPRDFPLSEIITITISAAGDCALGNHHEQDYYYSFRQAYDQAGDEGYFFENVKDIFSNDDMTMINLEGVLTYSEERLEDRTYSIKGDPSYAKILVAGSVEAVSLGNNHRLDYGEAGSRDTVAALEKEGIVYAYENKVGIFETKGIRIGFVSVNEASQGYAVEKIMENGINKLKEEEVDLIIASCHWGIEREYYPEDYQTILGRKCIDWGADLVLGHHPHVLQGIDYYKGKYIVYSLANFCFGANRNPEDKDTIIFQQTFFFWSGDEEGPSSKKIAVLPEGNDGARIIPCSVSSVNTRNDFKPTPAQGGEATRIINWMNELSAGFGVSFDKEGWITR